MHGASGLERGTGDRTVRGSSPTAENVRFRTLEIPFTPHCQCLSK